MRNRSVGGKPSEVKNREDQVKYSEVTEKSQEEIKTETHERWSQLNTLLIEISERASKQLFITNGAGAIALMSYFGVAKKEMVFFEMKISLALFVLGLILAMVVTSFLYQGYSFMLEGWRNDTRRFFADELSHAELYENDESRYKDSNENIAVIVSYLSFFCFIAGSVSTLVVMICGQSIF